MRHFTRHIDFIDEGLDIVKSMKIILYTTKSLLYLKMIFLRLQDFKTRYYPVNEGGPVCHIVILFTSLRHRFGQTNIFVLVRFHLIVSPFIFST